MSVERSLTNYLKNARTMNSLKNIKRGCLAGTCQAAKIDLKIKRHQLEMALFEAYYLDVLSIASLMMHVDVKHIASKNGKEVLILPQ